MSTIRRVLVTDPCYVKNPDEYKTMMSDGLRGMPSSKEPGHFVRVPVTESFFEELTKTKSHEAFSKTNYESFWSLGKPLQDNFSRLVYLGSHGSDSGLTCIVPEDPFSDDLVQPVDWTEFVLSTLDTAEGDQDALDEYQLYKFFGKIPDEGSDAAVFGVPSLEDSQAYDTIVIRSLEALSSDPTDIDKKMQYV